MRLLRRLMRGGLRRARRAVWRMEARSLVVLRLRREDSDDGDD